LNLIVSQRLVRKVCPHCSTKREADYSESAEISESVKKINDINPVFKLDFHKQIPQIVGCDQCNGT
jgi:type II secretory ATPase GspE/PulE/Tfp pilus assembly ATPase PilB-like protein